ncbi:uncharacterized protein LOC108158561 isoform X1 [Drosophila miranda]|uniref:uncharacterized protein LOC108158561 isoform X1 n=1 Tax=Drosophila miranda TaxID=7229 RepID=UPI00143F8814|nr:uncharacterized protein LOC108158561 isoform X1 [Drosophila miranda]
MRRSISETEHSESDLSSGATTESNSSDYEQEDRHHSSRVHDSTTAKRDNVMLPRPWASSGGWNSTKFSPKCTYFDAFVLTSGVGVGIDVSVSVADRPATFGR